MSQLIKSRNANQCRIFHLKLMKIGESIQEIFSLLSSNIDQYSQIYKKFKGKDRVDKSVEKTKNEGVVE